MMLGDKLHKRKQQPKIHVFGRISPNFQSKKKKKNFQKNLSSLQALSNSAYQNIATLLRLKAEMLGKKVIK